MPWWIIVGGIGFLFAGWAGFFGAIFVAIGAGVALLVAIVAASSD